MSLSPEGPRSLHDIHVAPSHGSPRTARDRSSHDAPAHDAAGLEPAAAEQPASTDEDRTRRNVWTLHEVFPSCPQAGKAVLEQIMDRVEQCT